MIRAPAATCEPAGRAPARDKGGFSLVAQTRVRVRVRGASKWRASNASPSPLRGLSARANPPVNLRLLGEGRANKLNGRRKVKWGLPWAALEPI